MGNDNGVYRVEYIANGVNIIVVDSENYIVRNLSVFVSEENVNGYEQCLQNFGYRRTFINI